MTKNSKMERSCVEIRGFLGKTWRERTNNKKKKIGLKAKTQAYDRQLHEASVWLAGLQETKHDKE